MHGVFNYYVQLQVFGIVYLEFYFRESELYIIVHLFSHRKHCRKWFNILTNCQLHFTGGPTITVYKSCI